MSINISFGWEGGLKFAVAGMNIATLKLNHLVAFRENFNEITFKWFAKKRLLNLDSHQFNSLVI